MTIFSGETVDLAIQAGLDALDIDRARATVTVVQTPKKGFLGLGKRPATVDIIVKPDPVVTADADDQPQEPVVTAPQSQVTVAASRAPAPASDETASSAPLTDEERAERRAQQKVKNEAAVEAVQDYLLTILEALGVDATVDAQLDHRRVALNFTTDKEGLLIGKHGRTINALQSLAQIFLNHHGASHINVELDVAGYRERRMETLMRLADKSAREVVAAGTPVYLDPMPSFERKQIHATLADNHYVTTYSAGKEPHRSVVIAPR